MLRIVQLLESVQLGGLERMAVDLALRQRAAGHQVAVYCFFGAGALRAELEEQGIPVTEFHKERRSNIPLVWDMAQRLRRERVDVIHAHNPGVHHAGVAAKVLAGVPVCINTRHSACTSFGTPYQERYFRLVGPWTDHVVFVCEDVRRQLAPRLRFAASKCSVIPNGIRQERFLAHPAAPASKLPRIRFGTVGRLVPAKAHAILIDAFAQIAEHCPQADLQIIGYGPLEGELRARIERLGMSGRIHLPGPTTDAARALAELDVFVISSVSEGLPLVILEAMTAGLPIVSTSVGGVPEVAPEKSVAWLCEPGNPEQLGKAMLRAANSAELSKRGAAARKLAIENYSLAQMNTRYEALYLRLLATASSTGRG